MTGWRCYTEGGYDPNDGLDETCGRWMRDTWGVVVWVQTQEPVKPKREEPTGTCIDCPAAINPRARRCRRCAGIEIGRAKREAIRKAA